MTRHSTSVPNRRRTAPNAAGPRKRVPAGTRVASTPVVRAPATKKPPTSSRSAAAGKAKTKAATLAKSPARPATGPRQPKRATAAGVRRGAPRGAAAASTARAVRRKMTVQPTERWAETLRDGTHVLIRPITRQDAALERAFIKRLSPQSRRLRFLGQIGEPSDELIRSLIDLDWRRDAAFIALVHREGEKREIGVSRYSMSPDGASCECAVTVDDEWHGRGLAVTLMRHLIELARSHGIRTMFSVDAVGNQRMRDLARFLGFERRADPGDAGQVVHTLHLGA